MSTAPRRRAATGPSKGDLREARLIAAARQLVIDDEFEQATVEDLAVAAEVSRPTFYFYFTSKQDLLARLVGLALSDIAENLAHGLVRTPNRPVARLRSAISRGADAWWENRAVMRSAVELAATDPFVYEQMQAAVEPVNALCVALLIEHGTVPEAGSPETAAELVLALAMMNERVLSHALKSAVARDDLRPTEQNLLNIWIRAMGLPGT